MLWFDKNEYYSCAGIGRALALTPVPILLGYYFDKRRSLAFGLASAGFSIGGLTVTPVVEILFQHFGYQVQLIVINILSDIAAMKDMKKKRKRICRRISFNDQINIYKTIAYIQTGSQNFLYISTTFEMYNQFNT